MTDAQPTIAEGIIAIVCGWVNDGQDPVEGYAGLRAQIEAVLELRVRRPARLSDIQERDAIWQHKLDRMTELHREQLEAACLEARIDECERALREDAAFEKPRLFYLQDRLAELRKSPSPCNQGKE